MSKSTVFEARIAVFFDGIKGTGGNIGGALGC